MALVPVEDGRIVVFALIAAFFVFGLFTTTHDGGCIEVGPALPLHRLEAETMFLAFGNSLILIVLHL